jgi:UDP-N-acetylmuramyl pentapeptide synthase
LIRFVPAVAIGRLVRWVARVRKPGGGSAIPGVVVNKIAPSFLPTVLNRFPQGLVVVTGTAGKSTTTRLLAAIVSAHGLRVFTNPSTANIAQGLTSAILSECSLGGRIDADIAILEVDEGHAARLSRVAAPRVSTLLNVCVDQIDRFFDPQLVADMLAEVARNTTQTVVFNRDDACVAGSAQGTARRLEFGMSPKLFASDARALGYARLAGSPARAGELTVTLQKCSGSRAGVLIGDVPFDLDLPSAGLHYGIDAVAALSTAKEILGSSFDAELAVKVVSTIDPVFGRGEKVSVRGQLLDLVLIQNPTSFRLNTANLSAANTPLMIAVGTDVRDYSYLWPVSLAHLPTVAIASGSKAEEVALHCLYNGVQVDVVEPDLQKALDDFLALPSDQGATKTIVFSADSMRRTRRLWGLSEQGAWS